MKRTVEYLGLASVMVLMLAAVLTYLAPHLGWRVDVVGSGSMAPTLHVGSLAVTRPVEAEAIAVGDIITFDPQGITLSANLITHRVIGIERNSPLRFRTRGDANEQADPFTVPARNLVGRVDFHAPYLGYVAQFLRTPWGFVFGLFVPGLMMTIMYIRSILQVLRTDREKKLAKVAPG